MSYLLAIDVEATGPNYRTNFVPCFGACIMCVRSGQILDTFMGWIRHDESDNKRWDEVTLRDFWLTKAADRYDEVLKALRPKDEGGVAESPQDVMLKFIQWCRTQYGRYGDELVIIADTAGFDVGWMNYYLSFYGPDNGPASLDHIFGQYRNIRDVSSFYFGIASLPLSGTTTHSERWAQRALRLRPARATGEIAHDHNPLHDAIVMGTTAVQILRAVQARQRTASIMLHDRFLTP